MTMQTVTYDDALWQIVPKENTNEMGVAGRKEHRISDGQIDYTYKAMLQAAPKPPIVADEVGVKTQEVNHVQNFK